MSKIDSYFIESAVRIRTEYLEIMEKLETYKYESKKLGEYLIGVADEMSKYSKEIEKKDSVNAEDVQKYTLDKFTEMEANCNLLTHSVESLNNRLVELRKDEGNLLVAIQQKHPDISDEEIRKQVAEKLVR